MAARTGTRVWQVAATVLLLTAAGPGTAQQAIREHIYPRLEQAHAALGEKRYAEAETRLGQLDAMELNEYERALLYQTYGYLYAGQGDFRRAADYFERSVALDALPRAVAQGMLYSLAGLYAAEEQFDKTIATLRRWLPGESAPSPDALIMMAVAHVGLDQYRQALPWVEKAIANAGQPIENWYQLLVAVHLELEDYPAAAETLRRMIASWPDRLSYWEMLSAAYQQTGKQLQAVATLRLAYRHGLLSSEKQILALAKMMLFIEDPYQAGLLLEREIGVGRLSATVGNLELLRNAWAAAKEFERAISVLERLAAMSGDGNYYLQKAQLYAERMDWAEAIPAAEQAIARGRLQKPAAAWFLKGMAEAELGKLSAALASLSQVAKVGDRAIAAQADGWIRYVLELQKARPAASGVTTN